MNKLNKINNPKGYILVYLLLAVTFGIIGPLTMYLTNINEFWFSIGDIWWIVLLGGLSIFFLCFFIWFIFKGKVLNIFTSIVFGLSLGFYIQGNYINTNYNVMDGKSIAWESYTNIAIINTIIWLVCLASPFIIGHFVKQKWEKTIKNLSIILILVQVVAFGIQCFTTDFNRMDTNKYLTRDGIYELSNNQNIVIFVLDAFDSSYFKEILNTESDEIEDAFKDFTYYPDCVGGATRTTLAMPIILTGKAWTESESYLDYLQNAYSNSELYSILKKYKYNINLYTLSEFAPSSELNIIENIDTGSSKATSNFALSKNIYKLTSFRYMPHLLKKYFWFYGEIFDQLQSADDKDIYTIDDSKFNQELLINNISVTTDKNVFSLYHLHGAHEPFNINEFAQKVNSEKTSEIQQAKGSLTIVKNYIKKTKKLGIYDNTTFIIMADHGKVGYEQNPLFMVKTFNENKRFEINYAPISYFDLHPTLMSIISGDYKLYGKTIYDFDEGDSRKRLFFRNASHGNKTKIVEYVISGKAWDKKTVSETGQVYLGDSVNSNNNYELGTTLIFGAGGNATQYLESGFSADEAGHTWTEGNSAEIELSLQEKLIDDLIIKIDASAFYEAGSQRMIVSVGDEIVHEGRYRDRTMIEFFVPKELVDKNTLRLKFEFPDSVSPSSLPIDNKDSRKLAFDFYRLIIDNRVSKNNDELLYYTLGEDILFNEENNGTRYFDYGISPIEEYFAWSSGKKAKLVLNIGKSEVKLASRIELINVYNGDQRVIIKSGEQTLYDSIVNENNKVLTFDIPTNCIKSGTVALDFMFPDAISPFEIGASSDERVLAVAFKTIVFEKKN